MIRVTGKLPFSRLNSAEGEFVFGGVAARNAFAF